MTRRDRVNPKRDTRIVLRYIFNRSNGRRHDGIRLTWKYFGKFRTSITTRNLSQTEKRLSHDRRTRTPSLYSQNIRCFGGY